MRSSESTVSIICVHQQTRIANARRAAVVGDLLVVYRKDDRRIGQRFDQMGAHVAREKAGMSHPAN